MSEIRTYYIKAFASAGGYTGDDLASYLENEPLYTDDIGTAVDVTAEIAALRSENERLRRLLSEVAEGGVEFADERVRYVAVQIDRETWAEVLALAKGDDRGRPA